MVFVIKFHKNQKQVSLFIKQKCAVLTKVFIQKQYLLILIGILICLHLINEVRSLYYSYNFVVNVGRKFRHIFGPRKGGKSCGPYNTVIQVMSVLQSPFHTVSCG